MDDRPPLTFAFFPEGAYGPTNNCVGIGDVLRRRGHRVVFIVEESFAGTLEAKGFEERLMRLGPPPERDEEPGQFWKEFIRDTAPVFRRPTIEQLEGFIAPTFQALVDGACYVDDRLREILDEVRPDVVVEDNVFAFPALGASGRPCVRIVSCNPAEIKDPAVPPAFSGLPTADRGGWAAFRDEFRRTHRDLHASFDAFCRERGAPPLGDLEFIHESPWLNLYVYPREVDYARERALGPSWHDLEASVRGTDEPWAAPDRLAPGDGPLVYLSLGSLGSADVALMQRLIGTLAATRYRVIVSMGPQHDQLRLADNMTGAEFLPQASILPQVDLVITHGGNNTVTECFFFGKPMVVLPLFWDQYDNAQRVHETGFGIRVDTYGHAPEELHPAAERLLADTALQTRLRSASRRLQSQPGTVRAADLIEAVGQRDRPAVPPRLTTRFGAMSDLERAAARAQSGGPERHRRKALEQGKLPVRERLDLLVEPGSFTEDALLANWEQDGLGADGVVTGVGNLAGRPLAVMANDPTVKAGSWGPKTVEKILRVQERALRSRVPMAYLVDSAGARITEQVQMFPGRRGAGRIFFNQVRMSGVVPQVCVLFGPSAAGGAYIPAFCDAVIMRDGNASMYLGSPRMAEMGIGEKGTLEEMGGARMHTAVSGAGHFLVTTDAEAIDVARRSLSYSPQHWQEDPPAAPPAAPASPTPIADIVPADENKPFDMRLLLDALVDADSFLEVHARWAKEVIVGYARLEGAAIGIVANQPRQKGGVLFVDSADKAARFIQTCNAFGLPLLFLADVPGFMIGTQVERQGIIRHGARMVSAVSEATVPKLSVIVRKAYGAGLYAMAGPAFEPEACLALPTASIAVMGPQAAVNAVFHNQLQAIDDPGERARRTEELRREYAADIDLLHLASELVVDAVVAPDDLRAELVRRFAYAADKVRDWPPRRNPVTPA